MCTGLHWTVNGYACLIQDCRGRYKSGGTFYKYLGEAEDGAATVEWIAKQDWCNGCVVTDGPSYLCHVQTSMALLRPQGLSAIFASKGINRSTDQPINRSHQPLESISRLDTVVLCCAGGFYNAHTSGVRNGGAFEARHWVWAHKVCRSHVLISFGSRI